MLRAHARPLLMALLLASCAVATAGCAARGQQYRHFTTATPLQPDAYLVLGFLGGREPWSNEKRSARQLALRLRGRFAAEAPAVHVETVENKKRKLAHRLIHNALDRNADGALDACERRSARIILYGQSFGGAAVVKLARELNALEIPVLLTIQVDSVGRGDGRIPANVSCAANLFQDDGLIIRGEKPIRADDPARTTILGNFDYDYSGKKIDLSKVSWLKKAFRTAHTKMDFDPEVWARVEAMIVHAIRTGQCGDPVGQASRPVQN
jgi:hypothetical protein